MDAPEHTLEWLRKAYRPRWWTTRRRDVGGCVNPRKYGGEKRLLAGCKRKNAALTTMLQRIAPRCSIFYARKKRCAIFTRILIGVHT